MSRITRWLSSLALLGVVGCGEAEGSPVLGSYQGQSERFDANNFGMRTSTSEDIITVTSAGGESVIVGLDGFCALEATASEVGGLTIAEQTCERELQSYTEARTFQGAGSVEGGELTLELQGEYIRTYSDGTPPLEGIHELSFTGDRR